MAGIAPSNGGIVVDVRVTPRASRPGLAGWCDASLVVRLNAPPVDGAANAELVEIFAKALDVPRRAVTIIAGQRGRRKRVHIAGVDVATAERLLREP